jgi:hypothetical protein
MLLEPGFGGRTLSLGSLCNLNHDSLLRYLRRAIVRPLAANMKGDARKS